MSGAPERLSPFGPRTFLVLSQVHNNNGSQSAVVKTVEFSRVVCHVAEPSRMWCSIHTSSMILSFNTSSVTTFKKYIPNA
jgi:hypothetical protein